jgi:hypothetical protein
MKPCFSSVASVRSTALIGSRATRTGTPWPAPRHAFGIRHAPGGDQDVAALDRPLAGGRANSEPDLLAGAGAHAKDFGRKRKLDAFGAEDLLHSGGNIGIFPIHDPRPGFDHGYSAAATATRPANPAALDNRGAVRRLCHVTGQQFPPWPLPRINTSSCSG